MPRPCGRSPIARCVAASIPRVTKRSSDRARLVEHAERGVARAGQLAGDVEHLRQQRLEVALGDERTADLDEPAQPLPVEIVAGDRFAHSLTAVQPGGLPNAGRAGRYALK